MVSYQDEIHARCLEAAGVVGAAPRHAWDRLSTRLMEFQTHYQNALTAVALEGYERRYDRDRAINFWYVTLGETLPRDVDRERRVIERLRQAGFFETLSRLREEPLAVGETSFHRGLRWAAEELVMTRAASMRLAAHAGDFDEVARGFDEIMMLARTISYQGPIGVHRSGQRLQERGTTELCHELMEYEFPEAVCARLLESMEHRPLAPPALALERHRARFRDRLQRLFTDDGRGSGYRIAPGAAAGTSSIRRFRDAFERRFVHPSRRAEHELGDTIIDAALAELSRPLDERPHADADDPPADIADRYAVAPQVTQDVSSFLASVAYQRRAGGTTRVMIALALFRARHGRLPETLDELVPEVLGELPVDPTTGTSFGYLRLRDDPSHRPYVIYSYGCDGRDDGGTFDADRPRRARAPRWEGLDEPLTLPRYPRPVR